MTKAEKYCQALDIELNHLPDFDDAIIGFSDSCGELKLVYSIKKIIGILMEQKQINEREAFECFLFDIESSLEKAPIFVNDLSE